MNRMRRPIGKPTRVLVTDAKKLPDPIAAIKRLARGSAVIFRDYEIQNRERLGRDLKRACHKRGVWFLVAADARLARRIRADGLHLPEWMIRHGNGRWRLWRQRNWIVTAAAHSPAALAAAARAGVDAAVLSPVFPTTSHPGAPSLGVLRFTAWSQKAGLCVYALGGMTPKNARRVKSFGFAATDGAFSKD